MLSVHAIKHAHLKCLTCTMAPALSQELTLVILLQVPEDSLALNCDKAFRFIGSLFLYSHKLEEEFEWLKKSEVLYYSVEKKGNVSSQLKHNPWSMKCHQQQLQRMKENAKHRNQYSILSS